MKIEFPKATPDQASILSDIAIESKGHWGYSRALLDLWRKDLRVEEAYIAKECVRTILVDGELVGFFAINSEDRELDHFWLLSKVIGKGVGKRAFQKVKEDCAELGIDAFTIVSDPNAEGFYLSRGAVRVGEVESVPQNRMLPKLRCRV